VGVTSAPAPDLAEVFAHARSKPISAMLRVRNEEDYLAAAVHSIAPLVDEVVIVDNASTDRTPEVIRSLVHELSNVRPYSYPHPVAKAGEENLAAVREGDKSSLHRMSMLSNWSLGQCRNPFILKWDGDMIAGPELESALQKWRSGSYTAMRFNGLNGHPDRVHLLASVSGDPAVVNQRLAEARVPGWALDMTYCDPETRLFPRFLARYVDALFWWCENLSSPLAWMGPGSRAPKRYCLELSDPQYLHVKYWKRSPHTNHSPDLKAMIEANLTVGPRLPDTWRRVVSDYRLDHA
jgi:glycosyltransferase involved in cell wall biosynthesis